MKTMNVLKIVLGAGLLAAHALTLSSCSSGKDGAGQVTQASIPSGMNPICPAADAGCCRGTSTIQDTSASCNSVFTPEANNQTAAAFAAHGASAGLDAGSKLASNSDTTAVGATAGTTPIDTTSSGSGSGISPTSDSATPFAAPSGAAVGSLTSGSSNGTGSAAGGGGAAGLGGGSPTAPANANILVGMAGTLPTSPTLAAGGGGRAGGSGGGSALGALAGMMGDLGGAGSAAGGKTNLNFGGKPDTLTGKPALASADPADYFLRLNTTDNIFKVVERRYQQTVLGWATPAVPVVAPASIPPAKHRKK